MFSSFLENCLIWYARKFPLERGKVRVVNTLWLIATRGRGHQRTATLLYGNYKAPCDLREMLQRQFYFFGTYYLEVDLLAQWSSAARQARVVFDVGANAGIYSLAALAANRRATVHAFEPTPEIADRLRTTALINGLSSLNVHESAVANHSGEASLIRYRGGGDNEGMNYIQTGPSDSIISPGGSNCEVVRVCSLDDFCESYGVERIDLIKIDVQGHEYSVLRGAESLLRNRRIGKVFIELNWDVDALTCPANDVIELLSGHGYVFSEPTEVPCWRQSGDWLRSLSDVIAVHPNNLN